MLPYSIRNTCYHFCISRYGADTDAQMAQQVEDYASMTDCGSDKFRLLPATWRQGGFQIFRVVLST